MDKEQETGFSTEEPVKQLEDTRPIKEKRNARCSECDQQYAAGGDILGLLCKRMKLGRNKVYDAFHRRIHRLHPEDQGNGENQDEPLDARKPPGPASETDDDCYEEVNLRVALAAYELGNTGKSITK